MSAEKSKSDKRKGSEQDQAMDDLCDYPVDPETASDESIADPDVSNEAGASEDDSLEAQLERMTSNWQRERASFINYKRRVEEEKCFIRKYASFDLALDLLKVLDYFESSVSYKENLPEEARNVFIGVEYTVQELKNVLLRHGITALCVSQGDRYDSCSMEAIESVEGSDVDDGTVLKVQRCGWQLHDRILRPAQVVVAVSPRVACES